MQFQVTKAFKFIFVFLSILSMANPLASSPRDNVVENGLDARQEAVLVESEQLIIRFITYITNALK